MIKTKYSKDGGLYVRFIGKQEIEKLNNQTKTERAKMIMKYRRQLAKKVGVSLSKVKFTGTDFSINSSKQEYGFFFSVLNNAKRKSTKRKSPKRKSTKNKLATYKSLISKIHGVIMDEYGEDVKYLPTIRTFGKMSISELEKISNNKSKILQMYKP